jgi:hypothetical protein
MLKAMGIVGIGIASLVGSDLLPPFAEFAGDVLLVMVSLFA